MQVIVAIIFSTCQSRQHDPHPYLTFLNFNFKMSYFVIVFNQLTPHNILIFRILDLIVLIQLLIFLIVIFFLIITTSPAHASVR